MNNSNGTNVLPDQSSVWCTKCGEFISGCYSGTVIYCTCPKERFYTEEEMRIAFCAGCKVGFATEVDAMKHFWKPFIESIKK